MNAEVDGIVYFDVDKVEYVPKHHQMILWIKGKGTVVNGPITLEVPSARIEQRRAADDSATDT